MYKVPLTKAAIQEKIDNIRGAIMMGRSLCCIYEYLCMHEYIYIYIIYVMLNNWVYQA
jgi:hypothetical protein